MGEDRRRFLKWLSAAPFAVGLAGCASGEPSGPKSPARLGPIEAAHGKNKADACVVTSRDVTGPFHRRGAPMRAVIAGQSEPGERIKISGRVWMEGCGNPASGALLDIWQADAEGRYDDDSKDYRLRGQVMADGEGYYAFETILPGRYRLGGSFRPAHIHFNVSAPGCKPVTTQLYFEGDPYLPPNDPCEGCNSESLSQRTSLDQGLGRFDIVLAKV